MYFPYLRGKQNELVLLRDQAELISNAGFVPIIEPVKKNSLSAIIRTLEALIENSASFIFIMNPRHGDFFSEPNDERDQELTRLATSSPALFNIGVIASQEQELTEIKDLCERYSPQQLAIIHYGFDKSKLLQAVLKKFEPNISHHLFIDTHTTNGYHSLFNSHPSRALIVDAFIKKPNSTNDLSKPVAKEFAHLEYLPSQFLCEYIKSLGFNGVIYNSALADGFNIAVFDFEDLPKEMYAEVEVSDVNIRFQPQFYFHTNDSQ